MTLVEKRVYDFRTAGQWTAGTRRNLTLDGDRLVVPDRLRLERLPGTGAADGRVLPAVDAAGRPVWLRPATRELLRRDASAVIERGVLDGPRRPKRLIAGRSQFWVLAANALDRYLGSTLQRLTPAPLAPGWRIADIAGDAADGVWLAETNRAGRWRLRHTDCWGRTCRDTIPLPGTGGTRAMNTTADGTRLFVLDPAGTVAVFDTRTGTAGRSYAVGPALLLSAEPGGRIHLLTPDRAGGTAVLRVIDPANGDIEDVQNLRIPPVLGPPSALAGRLVACRRGLAHLVTAENPSETRVSTYVTPALVSPPSSRPPWNRAEIDLTLPAGTTLEITWAATADRPAADLDRLPWRDAETVTYRGTGEDRLAAVLDDVRESTLWLRLRLHTPPGRQPPEISRLRVGYPGVTYLDHLPSPYRDSARSGDLRKILAPYELMLDGLDEALDALPARIDPETADDRWTGYLLSWLGFPALGDLPEPRRRDLLAHAGDLLRLRGTREGLELLLKLVTGGAVTVTDSADDPAAWHLGEASLGGGTLALAQQPRPARAGTMTLGAVPLGRGCTDPALVRAQHARLVTIALEKPDPIVDRLLPAVVPAHCRVRLVRTSPGSTRRLDLDLRLGSADEPDEPGARLYSDAHWQLGATTRPGHWQLPEPTGRRLH